MSSPSSQPPTSIKDHNHLESKNESSWRISPPLETSHRHSTTLHHHKPSPAINLRLLLDLWKIK
ncbi:uncharacterized protein DS421_1g01790 [Arachis hypogaea]|nr:uncharacterized protein DS421_1g01790 [Arachis hypogaea]